MKYYFIKPENVSRMVESLRKGLSFGFDVETEDNGHEGGGLDPYKGKLRLMQFSPDPERVYIMDMREYTSDWKTDERLTPLRELLEDPWIRKIGHNLKFDAKFVRQQIGCDLVSVFDTMLGSRVEGCGVTGITHGLGATMERILGREMDKSEQRSNWGANVLSERQITYAARDVAVMHELESGLIKRLTRNDLLGVANLENSCVMAMAQTELNGFLLDASLWRQQLRSVEGQALKAAEVLQAALTAGNRQTGLFGALEIDLGSTQQVADCLLQLGVPLPLTEKGNYTTNQDLLEPLRYDYPAVEHLQAWRALNKQLTSYGQNIIDLINPFTGRIHASFNQLRAPSGRMGCNNPNLQNVPQENEYRNCFKAAEGNTLVIADFSQIELRVMAAIAEDKAMIEAFLSGKDFHEATARQVFNLSDDAEVPPDQRTFAKRVNFGIGYGIGAKKLARMCGISDEMAEQQLERYFVSRPGLKKWLKSQKYRGTRQGYVRTLSGRKAKFREWNKHDRGETGQIERLACNIPIQGTAADIFKRALCLIHEEFKGTTGKLVNLVHDEFVAECSIGEAELIATKLETAMSKAGAEYITSVPITADAKISPAWKK